MMFVIIVITVLCLALILHCLVFLTSFASPLQGYKIYENQKMGIRFSYPASWGDVIDWSPNAIGCGGTTTIYSCFIILPIDKTFAAPLLKITNNFEAADFQPFDMECQWCNLTQYVKQNYMLIQKITPGFSLINSNKTMVGEMYPSWQFEYSKQDDLSPNTRETNLEVLTTAYNTFYRISYDGGDDSQHFGHLATVKKVIDSMEFIPAPKTHPKPHSITSEDLSLLSNLSSIQNTDSDTVQILSHSSYVDSIGAMHIVGEVRNNSPSTAEFVKIIATFYDGNHRVVATDFTYTDPSTMLSGKISPFHLILPSASVPIEQIDSYKLGLSWD